MQKFIESLFEEKNILNFSYEKYQTLFVSGEYDTYYLFFFINTENQLIELKEKTHDIFQAIKRNKELYDFHMDKNIICIYCLCVSDEEYYAMEATNTVSELSKVACSIEEDLNYFKKNVFVYTNDMNQFADENIGRFELLCREYITENNFQQFKEVPKENKEYDFLINLFIKLPFLKFNKYQIEQRSYRSIKSMVNEEIDASNIDKETFFDDMNCLEEKLEDKDALYLWLDELADKRQTSKENLEEAAKDEN